MSRFLESTMRGAVQALPSEVGYSQHYRGERNEWADVEKILTHPIIYVSKGGHASYFTSGLGPAKYLFEPHNGDGVEWQPADYNLEILSSNKWLNFQGSWGADNQGSSNGPVYRHSKPGIPDLDASTAYLWVDPLYWQNRLTDI